MVITMAKLRMAHASTHGARKPPGPITVLRNLMLRKLKPNITQSLNKFRELEPAFISKTKAKVWDNSPIYCKVAKMKICTCLVLVWPNLYA